MRDYIGSTAAADICGCGFNSPLTLFMQLTGLAPETEPTEEMEAGLFLEAGVIKMLEKKLDARICTLDHVRHWKHPDYEMIQGTDDGALIKKPFPKSDTDIPLDTGVEVKLVGPHLAREFGVDGDEIPARYILQCQHNLMTGRRKRFVVGAFFMAEMRLRVFHVERDEDLCETLLERELHFWNENVLKNCAPKEDDPKIVKEYLSRRYPSHSLDMIEADDELRKLGYRLASVRHDCKRLDAERDELENTLRAVIGGDEGINFDAENLCTWRKARDGVKTNWHEAFNDMCGFAHVVEGHQRMIIEKHTIPVTGSRRLLVKGPIFDGDPTVADMRGTLLENSV